MSNELWVEAARALRSSQAAAPLRKFLEAEYDKRRDQLVSNNDDVTCGKAQELRKLLKDLFEQEIDTP